MKHYLFEVATGDKKIAGKGAYEYDSEEKALASYHKKMGIAMDSDLYESELITVVDENGLPIKSESYVNKNYVPQAEVVTE